MTRCPTSGNGSRITVLPTSPGKDAGVHAGADAELAVHAGTGAKRLPAGSHQALPHRPSPPLTRGPASWSKTQTRYHPQASNRLSPHPGYRPLRLSGRLGPQPVVPPMAPAPKPAPAAPPATPRPRSPRPAFPAMERACPSAKSRDARLRRDWFKRYNALRCRSCNEVFGRTLIKRCPNCASQEASLRRDWHSRGRPFRCAKCNKVFGGTDQMLPHRAGSGTYSQPGAVHY